MRLSRPKILITPPVGSRCNPAGKFTFGSGFELFDLDAPSASI